jgi:hypothetical protein
MSNLVAHAERELEFMKTGDEMNEMMRTGLLDIVKLFSEQGHSGFSASYAVNHLEKLLRFEPVGPLRGTDDEWLIHDHDEHCYAQNKRCGRVFKDKDGRAYDIDAVVFREPSGSCFTSRSSRQYVTFPYTPRTVYADVPLDATDAQKEKLAAQAMAKG